MNTSKKALLLVGSPKESKSTSESLGMYLLSKMQEQGIEVGKIFIPTSIKSENGIEVLLQALDHSSIVILAFPLYVDSLPFPVIRAMELIAQHRRDTGNPRGKSLAAICNCGFPEAQHTDIALEMCRQFARETGMDWAGGLGLGGGGVIDGRPLKELKGVTKNIKRALDITAEALSEGKPVPEEAVQLMSKPLIPRWLYLLIGWYGWRREAKKNGAFSRIHEQPYASEDFCRPH